MRGMPGMKPMPPPTSTRKMKDGSRERRASAAASAVTATRPKPMGRAGCITGEFPRGHWGRGANASLLLRDLLAQRHNVLGGQLGTLGAEAGGDVIGHCRDLVVGIGVAEGGHEDVALGGVAVHAIDHGLRRI